jgi:DNA-binding response OmpR family regulator
MKPKVLIVADDLETARSLHAVLSLAGYEVVATEAFSIAENTNPDVVIVDESSLKDPSCTNWLEQHLTLAAILLVSPEQQNLVSNFPSSAFLIKPVSSLQLIHSVYASLHRNRAR